VPARAERVSRNTEMQFKYNNKFNELLIYNIGSKSG